MSFLEVLWEIMPNVFVVCTSPIVLGLMKKLYSMDVKARQSLEQINDNTRDLANLKEVLKDISNVLEVLDKKNKEYFKRTSLNTKRLSNLETGSRFGTTEYQEQIKDIKLNLGILKTRLSHLEDWSKTSYDYKPLPIDKQNFN